jgi:hypothetical protein
MAGRRPLKGGAVRLLGHHGGVEGVNFRRAFDALAEALGPFTRLQAYEASRVAGAWANFEAASRALATARRARMHGKGRRPNAQAVEKLARRQGLADGSYSQALAALRALGAERNGSARALSPDDLLAAIGRDRQAP